MANSILDIKDILNDYSKDIQEKITNKAIEVSKNGVSELKVTSPKNKKRTTHKGRYAKGWKVKTEKGFGTINCTIYNSTDWQLTHLLERGHKINRKGKQVGVAGAKVHIEPVHDKVVKEFENGVEKIIRDGG